MPGFAEQFADGQVQLAASRVDAGDNHLALVADSDLMIAMDQFKDVRGFARYASRLRVAIGAAIVGWLAAGFDETIGGLIGVRLGPRRVQRDACDPEIVARYVPASRDGD